MRRLIVVCLSLLLASPALSQEVNEKLLRDYIGLCKLLRANGVEPVLVNWTAVENACLGIKEEADMVPYNRCRFDKAMDASLYPTDRTICTNRARADYPDALLLNQPTLTIAQKGGSTTFFQQPTLATDLDAKRSSSFDQCMTDRGWRDPQNASRGRVLKSY